MWWSRSTDARYIPRVRLGQVVGVGLHLVDGEQARSLRAGRALQRLEALQRHAATSGDELQEARASLLVEHVDGLPEPAHHVRVVGAVLEARVRLPVSHVDLAQTADHQLRAHTNRRVTYSTCTPNVFTRSTAYLSAP